MAIGHEATTGAVVNKVTNAATYAGSGAALYFGMTANEIAAFGGLLIGVIGLLANIWYKHQHLKIAKKRVDEPEDAHD